MGDLADVCDAVAADLERNLSLPRHTLWKYLDPPVVRGDLCPILAVFVRQDDETQIATDESYEASTLIVVSWFENALAGTETGGVGDPKLAEETLRRAETFLVRLRDMGDAIPALEGQSELSVQTARLGLISGGVYAVEVESRVTRWT